MLLLSSNNLCSSCSVYLLFRLSGCYVTLWYFFVKVSDQIRLTALSNLAYCLVSDIAILMSLK